MSLSPRTGYNLQGSCPQGPRQERSKFLVDRLQIGKPIGANRPYFPQNLICLRHEEASTELIFRFRQTLQYREKAYPTSLTHLLSKGTLEWPRLCYHGVEHSKTKSTISAYQHKNYVFHLLPVALNRYLLYKQENY